MSEKLKVLDLFSGIGGFSLGLERTGGFKTVAFCEIDDFCQKVLKKHWPDVPAFCDIHELTKEKLIEAGVIGQDGTRTIDLICGGPPCQPASCAWKRKGTADDRWLWPEALRIVAIFKPKYCLFENPTGILSLQNGVPFDQVLSDLENQGYETATFIIPACGVNAPHRRDRVWIMAFNPNFRDWDKREIGKVAREENTKSSEICNDVAHSMRIGWRRRNNEDVSGQGRALQTPGSGAKDEQEQSSVK